jgi:phosphatidylinositol alpha-1,6-mannosyltransferase
MMRAERKLRCLALVGDAFGGRGGIAQYNRDLLNALVASGRVASVRVLPRHAPDPVFPPETVHQMSPRGRLGFAIAGLARGLTHRVDVVFCGHVHFARLASLIARTWRAKLIVQTHGVEIWSRPKAAWSVIEKSDLILCVSRHTRRLVCDQAAIAPERAVVLSNTVGDMFTPGDASEFRKQHGLRNKRLLLTVGRLASRERYKGHDRVISAMPELLAQGYDLLYLIAGDGDDRARLEQLAREHGLEDRVRFLGTLAAEQLVGAYRAADIFVMPSTGEGFGISYLEAMACGTPALGLAAGGATDALADGFLGMIVEEHDLRGGIARLLSAPPLRGHVLAEAVQKRFGSAMFQKTVDAVLARLFELETPAPEVAA